ncbi:hypothetical protein VTO42DRAFT_1847 [Malbranchea cinnamomea]
MSSVQAFWAPAPRSAQILSQYRKPSSSLRSGPFVDRVNAKVSHLDDTLLNLVDVPHSFHIARWFGGDPSSQFLLHHTLRVTRAFKIGCQWDKYIVLRNILAALPNIAVNLVRCTAIEYQFPQFNTFRCSSPCS